MLKLKYGVASLKLIPSSGGAFEIVVGGRLIYSKLKTGEFPAPDDIVQKVRSLRPGLSG